MCRNTVTQNKQALLEIIQKNCAIIFRYSYILFLLFGTQSDFAVGSRTYQYVGNAVVKLQAQRERSIRSAMLGWPNEKSSVSHYSNISMN